ncbi:MAG: hypothetical protein B7Z26_04580, partial [Asticcacaulis sp. 32-58-5]
MSHQIPLKLELPERYGVSDLIVSDVNQHLIDLLGAPHSWLNPHLFLIGPHGSGKTHLAHIFSEVSQAQFITAADTCHLNPNTLPDTPVVIDDAEQADEEALFHLYNHSLQTSQPLLLLSRTHPLSWQTALPD